MDQAQWFVGEKRLLDRVNSVDEIVEIELAARPSPFDFARCARSAQDDTIRARAAWDDTFRTRAAWDDALTAPFVQDDTCQVVPSLASLSSTP